MKVLIGCALAWGVACCFGAAEVWAAEAAADSSPYAGCEKIFDGKTFEGWEADPSTWSIVDGAMRGKGGTSRVAYTKKDYGSFRLIFSARMPEVNGDHLGVLFWGDRPTDPAKPKVDLAGWVQFMPPHGAMWDYHPPKHHNLKHEEIAKGGRDFEKWSVTELLCNLEKGTMRAAVDGVEIVRYAHEWPTERTDPEKKIIAGPIGMFRHGGGTSDYKEIYVEADPKEDRLITADAVALEGKWSMASGQANGQAMPADMVRTGTRVAKDGVTSVTIAGKLYFKASFTIDPSQTPKAIDYAMTEGPTKGSTQLGIYDLQGDTVTFCFAAPGKDRPTEFTAEAGSEQTLSVWRKDAQ